MRDKSSGGQVVSRSGGLVRFAGFLRSIAGMPDYQRHVEHLRRCHPGKAIPSQQQYYQEYLQARYQDGPTRCC